jgi:aminopeptidase-like protein
VTVDLTLDLDLNVLGSDMFRFIEELFPICRSITGDGIRQTFELIGKRVPLDIHEVPTGTHVLDWTVPKEWNIRDAYVADGSGRRIVDFREHNLHVVSYSVPIDARLPLSELKERVHTLPDQPDVIPYRTSYYEQTWGFCMQQHRWDKLPDGEYDVKIDSSLEDGSLTYAECFMPGETEDEVLISCHCCHPSIANDNLSGIALATTLAEHLRGLSMRYSYRFLFIPGTIGSITWLAMNEDRVHRIKHGLVVTCVGDAGHPTYKRSRRGNALIDRAAAHVLRHSGQDHEVRDFFPYGYDERQYCSPGFDLAVGSLMRTPNGEYPEYHTSADNLEFIRADRLADSLDLYLRVLDVLENDALYVNLSPKGEPQLGKRGLYPSMGAQGTTSPLMARLWVLNLSDGEHSLLDMAERADMPFTAIREAAQALIDGGLLERVDTPSPRKP